MGRRPRAGRDLKIIQGQRRDAFFKKMRRKGGVPRLPSDGVAAVAAAPIDETAVGEEDVATAQEAVEGVEAIATEEGATEQSDAETESETAEAR